MQAPATMLTLDETKRVDTECNGYKGTGDDPDHYVKYGPDVITEAECKAAGGNFMKKDCKDAKGSDLYALMYCCGKSASYLPDSLGGNIKVTGELKIEAFTDNKCATAAPASAIPVNDRHLIGATHKLAECKKDSDGGYFAISGCNGTATDGMWTKHNYYDSSCEFPNGGIEGMTLGCLDLSGRLLQETTNLDTTGMTPEQLAAVQSQAQAAAEATGGTTPASTILDTTMLSEEQLAAFQSQVQAAAEATAGLLNGTTTAPAKLGSAKVTCDGVAAAEKVFKAVLQMELGVPANPTAAVVTAIKTTYEKEITAKFTASVAVAEAKIEDVHLYTGALKTRRQLSVRRKLSTSTTATSEFTTTLPAAKADQAYQAVLTSTNSGVLSSAKLEESMMAAFAADDTLKNLNITATAKDTSVRPPVAKPVDPVPPAAPSTSSAFESYLAAVVGAIAGILLLF